MYYYKILFLQYLRSPYTYFSFALPIFLLFGFGWMIPVSRTVPSVITTGIISIGLFLFGANLLEFRKTSMIKSISMTKLSKTKFLTINIVISLFFSFIILILFMFLAWFFVSVVPFLATNYTYFTDPHDAPYVLLFNYEISWGQIRWLTFIYAFIFTVVMTYILAFFFISISKTTTFYYLISFMYIFTFMFVSNAFLPGLLSNNFRNFFNYLLPHSYTNNLLTLSLKSQNTALGQFENDLVNIYPQYGGMITQVFDGVEKFLGSIKGPGQWDWGAMQSDLNTFNDYFANSGPLYNKTVIGLAGEDFNSKLFIFLNTPFYTYSIGGKDIEITIFVILFADATRVMPVPDIIKEITPLISPESFSTYMQYFIDQENVLLSLIGTPLWDFENLESMLNSFVPPVFTLIVGTVAIKRFTWSIR